MLHVAAADSSLNANYGNSECRMPNAAADNGSRNEISQNNNIMSINKRAIISGTLGATASFIAKLAFAPESPVSSAVQNVCIANAVLLDRIFSMLHENSSTWICPTISIISRGLCLVFMIGMNAFMISTFLDGMDESGSVVGTALSTAANFCWSAFYGVVFFNEIVSPSWYMGASIIALGMFLLSAVNVTDENKRISSKKVT